MKSYTYDAYGNTSSTGSFINSFAYTGAVIDTETGLYYMNARYYDPETGRFISQDTYKGDEERYWHFYLYCNGDPVNYTDPTGNKSDEPTTTKIYSGHRIKSFWKPSLPVGGIIMSFTVWYTVDFKYTYKYVKGKMQFLSVSDITSDMDGFYIIVYHQRSSDYNFYTNEIYHDSIQINIYGKWTVDVSDYLTGQLGVNGKWVYKWSNIESLSIYS